MAQLTIIGAAFTAGSVSLLGVSLRSIPESRARFLANWWALTFAWFGVVLMLSGEMLP